MKQDFGAVIRARRKALGMNQFRLAEETGVPVCALDTLASGPDNPPLDYYEITMLNNLLLISDALSE